MGPTPLRRVTRLSYLQVSTLSSSFGQGLAVFAQGESRAAVDQNSPDVRQIKSSRDEEDVKHGRAGHGFKLEGNIQGGAIFLGLIAPGSWVCYRHRRI